MKIVIIDGQGGKMGAQLITKIKESGFASEVYAIGTNSTATASMLKSGADYGATGENPVIVNVKDADFILGPIGIVCADSLFGEITPNMAVAVGQSSAVKILIPVNRCNTLIVGVGQYTLNHMVKEAVEKIEGYVSEMKTTRQT